MDIVPVPETAKQAYPDHVVVDMGPPDGVSDDDCGTAQMQLGRAPSLPGFGGRDQLAYFKPAPHELDRLNAGGLIVMNQIGNVVQPFSVGVWGPFEEPEPMVEIGGQRMTQAQFDAARAPLVGPQERECRTCGARWTAPVANCPICPPSTRAG